MRKKPKCLPDLEHWIHLLSVVPFLIPDNPRLCMTRIWVSVSLSVSTSDYKNPESTRNLEPGDENVDLGQNECLRKYFIFAIRHCLNHSLPRRTLERQGINTCHELLGLAKAS